MKPCERKPWCGHDEAAHVPRVSVRRCLFCPCVFPIDEPRQPMDVKEKAEAGARIGQELKEAALVSAEASHASDLNAARMIRDRIAIERGTVTADDVRLVFERHRGVNAWGPWAGALFRGGQYVATGEFKPSVFATNHGAVIRVWRRKA